MSVSKTVQVTEQLDKLGIKQVRGLIELGLGWTVHPGEHKGQIWKDSRGSLNTPRAWESEHKLTAIVEVLTERGASVSIKVDPPNHPFLPYEHAVSVEAGGLMFIQGGDGFFGWSLAVCTAAVVIMTDLFDENGRARATKYLERIVEARESVTRA